MPLIFLTMDWLFTLSETWQRALLLVVMLLIVGAVVGAIHGFALIVLERRTRLTNGQPTALRL